jgi:hypothetical protein
MAGRVHVRETKRPRAGRRFSPIAEAELEPDALRAIRGLPGAYRDVAVFRELTGPFGIPDFLAVVGSRATLQRRIELGVPPLINEIDAGIVSQASPKAARRTETLAKQLGWSVGSVERRLPGLLRSGALCEVSAASYVRPAALAPIGRLYAIETKVRDFSRALRQARTYAVWCDNYVIVMPRLSAASLASAQDLVAGDGGGLVVGGKWIKRVGRRRLAPSRRLWGSEHVVAAAMGVMSETFRRAV